MAAPAGAIFISELPKRSAPLPSVSLTPARLGSGSGRGFGPVRSDSVTEASELSDVQRADDQSYGYGTDVSLDGHENNSEPKKLYPTAQFSCRHCCSVLLISALLLLPLVLAIVGVAGTATGGHSKGWYIGCLCGGLLLLIFYILFACIGCRKTQRRLADENIFISEEEDEYGVEDPRPLY